MPAPVNATDVRPSRTSPADLGAGIEGDARFRRGVRITVRGRVSPRRLALRLRQAVRLPVGWIRVDLTGVESIDVEGLEVLIEACREAREREVQMFLESPSRARAAPDGRSGPA